MSEKKPICSFCGAGETAEIPLIAGIEGHICENCVQLAHQVIRSWGRKRALAELHNPPPSPEALKNKLDEYVIGQDTAKEILSVAVYNHYKRLHWERSGDGELNSELDVELGKSNILLLGPSGSGKTLLASTLARLVNVPFIVADATTLTQAGYVGEDVETILKRLLEAAEGDVGRAEWGIVYIDEIDKLARSPDLATGVRDVSGEGVQQALLKMVEGSRIKVPVRGKRRDGGGDEVSLDTTHILFIAGGAFSGLPRVIAQRMATGATGIGFHAEFASREVDAEPLVAEVDTEDLRRFGLIPEFIGRFPVVAQLDPLDEEALIRILTETRHALTRQYRKLLAIDGVALEFTPEALAAIAREALRRGTGARGLRSVLERLLRQSMFKIPSSNPPVARCIVDEAAVTGDEPVRLIFAEAEQSRVDYAAVGG
ncbi:MAG: ATP-dependent Clp protease ATP-binding subunit ClpX [Methylohalobius crimeensis]